jgi:Zn-dependent peptidase ImmA (M78 family)
MWIKTALDTFKELNNTYEYNRNALIEFFPEIRWHSKSVDLGLTTIIQKLFKMGITVVFQSPLSSLHLRGATFSVNNKPCIAITDYRGFYPTIWFALVHELFHVLFDWEEIRNNQYHISTNDEEHLSLAEKEKEADNFAREYLFSMEKMSRVKAHINDQDYIKEFAENNHVHPSFVYVFYAYDMHDAFYWSKAQKLNPKIDKLKKLLENPWDNPMPISTFINSIRHKYYN